MQDMKDEADSADRNFSPSSWVHNSIASKEERESAVGAQGGAGRRGERPGPGGDGRQPATGSLVPVGLGGRPEQSDAVCRRPGEDRLATGQQPAAHRQPRGGGDPRGHR